MFINKENGYTTLLMCNMCIYKKKKLYKTDYLFHKMVIIIRYLFNQYVTNK